MSATSIRVVGGNPSAEEIAVVTAVLMARAAASARVAVPQTPTSMWGRPFHVRNTRPRSWSESRLPR